MGIHSNLLIFLESSSTVTVLVSQMWIQPSSEHDIKKFYLPSTTDLLSTRTFLGTNWISLTYDLCERSILDMMTCLSFTAVYWVLSSSSSGILATVGLRPAVILCSKEPRSQVTTWPLIAPPMTTLGFSGWNSIVVISTGVWRM